MPLSIRYVSSLEYVIDPTVDFLSRPVDLFARQRIVVPTAGAKAWLAARLAERLGASQRPDGQHLGDGIVANVDFLYPGTISSLILESVRPDADPWDVDRLTFTVLQVLAKNQPAFEEVVKRAGGPLLAARRIADRFDHYHFRRPGMIREWENGNAKLSPEADEAGKPVEKDLPRRDYWQFDLWRKVRATIGKASPPAREKEATGPAPEAVLVAGLQGLSLHQITLLKRLATMPTKHGSPCKVDVLLVHPSPPLRKAWAEKAPPVSKDTAPARGEPEPASDADPLVDAWLRGTRESQWLLASQGHDAVHDPASTEPTVSPTGSLLARLKHTVASGEKPDADSGKAAFDPADHSVRIHRCHDLGRQAEVLHDAILHAFREIPGLAPHEVVILSPQIANLAPHLEAVFNREVTGDVSGDKPASLQLPLLVADRGIREVSRGAELLAAIIELIGSRCSVDGMLAVAEHPLVLDHFGLEKKQIVTWQRCIERTKIRWGLDAARRGRGGLDRIDLPAHTWRLGLERALLGAVVPDGDPEVVLGGIVPLGHVAAADVSSLAPLVTIFGIIDDLDQGIAEARPVGAWCDLLEQTLGQLAGVDSDELAVPMRELDTLRKSAAAAKCEEPAEVAVPWHDLKTILAATLTAPVGRQPLRTGVITATSLIPLRGVPFRVVCLAGYDDGAVAPREGDNDDLAERQQLLGDRDRSLEVRRELLDCLVAAGDRLVITCTGRDVKNNKMLPLVTPLAEFTDFVARHGVPPLQQGGEAISGIEIVHPRHACSRGNFVAGENGLLKTDAPWSHDAAALAAAEALGREPKRPVVAAVSAEPMPQAVPEVIELKWLAEFMHDPLWPYVRKTLGINTWRDDDLSIPATLPLELEYLEKQTLRDAYMEQLLTAPDAGKFAEAWAADVTTNGDVPVLGYGDDAVAEITQFSADLLRLAIKNNTPLTEKHPKSITLQLDGVTLAGEIERCYPDAESVSTIVLVRPDASDTQGNPFGRTKALAAVQLLVARAENLLTERALIFVQRDEWHPGKLKGNGRDLEEPAQVRVVELADGIDSTTARQALEELGRLYRLAASKPHGLFGKTANHLPDDIDQAADAFTDFTTKDRYPQSNEAVVFGGQPDFDLVFGSSELKRMQGANDFYRRFKKLAEVPYDKSAKKYIYAPDTA
jgi:exodeoxyribonuclease V gamma subunit